MSGAAPGRAGCLLALLQTSASMARSCRYRGQRRQRLATARFCLDHTIQQLLALHAAGDPLAQGLRVGILDFGGGSLLPGAAQALPPLETLAGLAGEPRSKNGVPRWITAREPNPEAAPLGHALAEAQRLLVSWMAESPEARPPVLLLCGDGDGWDGEADRLGRSLSLLATPAGPLRLVHALVRDAIDQPFFTTIEELMRQESDLPAPGPPTACAMRLLTTPKRGNSEQECEDGGLGRPDEGRAMVCDGAGEGIFTRRWVQQLIDSYAEEKLDAADRTAFLDWLQRCRQAWHEAIDFGGLRGYQQNKVLDIGAGGTFLAWQLDSSLAWRAWAVGDACLFWVRGEELQATFPMVHWRHFGRTPYLLRSRRDVPVPAPVFASGRCLPGDRFFLATDAVAQELLRSVDEGNDPGWNTLSMLDAEGWRERIEERRDAGRIVNDDATLLSVEVL